MEFIIVFTLYMFGAFVSSFFLTSASYKSYLKLDRTWNSEELSEEANLAKEAEYRKVSAKTAKTMGAWFAILWFIILPFELIASIIIWCGRSVDIVAIDAHDRDFKNKVASIKAQKILDEYDAEQKAEFDKLVS